MITTDKPIEGMTAEELFAIYCEVWKNEPGNRTLAASIVKEVQRRTNRSIHLRKLLKALGAPAECKRCGQTIYWIVSGKTGKKNPITEEGISHFADCPNAKEFKRGA